MYKKIIVCVGDNVDLFNDIHELSAKETQEKEGETKWQHGGGIKGRNKGGGGGEEMREISIKNTKQSRRKRVRLKRIDGWSEWRWKEEEEEEEEEMEEA